MKHYEDLTAYFDLNEATKQIITKAFNVKEAALNTITATNSDVFFIIYNGFNEYYMKLIDSSNYYVKELQDRCNNIENVF